MVSYGRARFQNHSQTNENAHFTDGEDVMGQVYTPITLRKQQRKWLPQLFMSSNNLTFLPMLGYSTVSDCSFSQQWWVQLVSILFTFLFYRWYICYCLWECKNLLNSLYIGIVSSRCRCVKSSYICLYSTWILAHSISKYFIYFSLLSLVYMLVLMRMQKSFKFTVYW